MLKEDVVIEPIEHNRVYVIPYDVAGGTTLGGVMDICSHNAANRKYNVIGEIYNGEAKLYSNVILGDDYDYSEFLDPDLEDESKMNRIKKLIEEDRIFKTNETKDKIYYIVKGTSNKVYEVIYDKSAHKFYCTCDNVRLTNCYHIRAVKLFMTINER